jgi:hypothetical protein
MAEGIPLNFHGSTLYAQASLSAHHPDNIGDCRTCSSCDHPCNAIQAMTARMWEGVVHGNADTLHLCGDTEQGGTRGHQPLKRGNEEREDTCATTTSRLNLTCRGIVAFPDPTHELGVTAEAARA